MTAPDLSVVVCSHNGERTLPATLAHLRRQSLSASRYELIVVDDGSSDRTSGVARSHGAHVVRLDARAGVAAARNAGAREAKGLVVAFTDDDCEPAENWLETLAANFSDGQLDGLGGRVLPACTNGFLKRYLQAHNPLQPLPSELLVSTRPGYRLRLYLRKVRRSHSDLPRGALLYCAPAANMAFRRELIFDIGGFDEAFAFAGEDEDFCRRAHSRPQRVRLRYDPAAIVVHRFKPRFRDSLRRSRAYGVGHAQAAIKHADLRPILYPFPLCNAAAILLALVSGRRMPMVFGVLAPWVEYSSWVGHVRRHRSLEPLIYPYLQLAEEAWMMLGELQGWRAGYERAGAPAL